jgi:hypothetical protein
VTITPKAIFGAYLETLITGAHYTTQRARLSEFFSMTELTRRGCPKMSWQLFFEKPLPWPSEERGSPLCQLCKSLIWRFSQVKQKPWAYEQSKDLKDRKIEDVEHFVKRGCHFCHLLIRSLSDEDIRKIKEHTYTRLEIRSYYNPCRQSRQLKKFYVYIYCGRTEYGSHVNSITKLFRVEDAGESSFIRVMVRKLISG